MHNRHRGKPDPERLKRIRERASRRQTEADFTDFRGPIKFPPPDAAAKARALELARAAGFNVTDRPSAGAQALMQRAQEQITPPAAPAVPRPEPMAQDATRVDRTTVRGHSPVVADLLAALGRGLISRDGLPMPGLGETARNTVSGIVEGIRSGSMLSLQPGAEENADAEMAVGITPVVGELQAIRDAIRAYREGSIGWTTINALGAIPIVGVPLRWLRRGDNAAEVVLDLLKVVEEGNLTDEAMAEVFKKAEAIDPELPGQMLDFVLHGGRSDDLADLADVRPAIQGERAVTREEFLNAPLVDDFGNGQLDGALLERPPVSDVEAEPFKVGDREFTIRRAMVDRRGTPDRRAADRPDAGPDRRQEDTEEIPWFEVFDGDRKIATYRNGGTLVVDPEYRRLGIGEELMFDMRARFPDLPLRTRTPTTQRMAQRVYDRIEAGERLQPSALDSQLTIDDQVLRVHNSKGGSSFNVGPDEPNTNIRHGGNLWGRDLWMVGGVRRPTETIAGRPLTIGDIRSFRERHADALAEEGNYLGTWIDRDGVHHLDVANGTPDYIDAMHQGIQREQESIFNLASGQTRYVSNVSPDGVDLGEDASKLRREWWLKVREWAHRPETAADGAAFDELGVHLSEADGIDEASAEQMAQVYERATSNPDDPAVREAWEAFGREVEEQYRFITEELGFEFEFSAEDPYPTSRAFMEDMFGQRRMRVFASPDDFHPILTPAQNNMFRAVHDFLGHGIGGNQIHGRGEENALRDHWPLFSPTARKALVVETRGQNSWFNFGPQRDLPPSQRAFAEQKVFMLDEPLGARILRGRQRVIPEFVQDAPPPAGARGVHGGGGRAVRPGEAARNIGDDAIAARQELLEHIYRLLPSTHDLAQVALVGQGARRWYQEARQAINAMLGPDAPRFAALMAATSPRTSVETNVSTAIRIWGDWAAAGRPDDPTAIREIFGRHMPRDPKTGGAWNTWANNAEVALTVDDPSRLRFTKGGKILDAQPEAILTGKHDGRIIDLGDGNARIEFNGPVDSRLEDDLIAAGATPVRAEETITGPAIQIQGRVFTGEPGELHADVLERAAAEMGGIRRQDFPNGQEYNRAFDEWLTTEGTDLVNGFGTNHRPFVGRGEAAEIADNLGQRGPSTDDLLGAEELTSPSEGATVYTVPSRAAAKRVMAAADMRQVPDQFSGPKVFSFFSDLEGDLQAVTMDSWMARAFGMDSRLLGDRKAVGQEVGFSPAYVAGAARMREAARHLSQLTGNLWSPAEVQASLWAVSREMFDEIEAMPGILETLNTPEGAGQLLRAIEQLDPERIRNAESIGQLLRNDPDIGRELRVAGLVPPGPLREVGGPAFRLRDGTMFVGDGNARTHGELYDQLEAAGRAMEWDADDPLTQGFELMPPEGDASPVGIYATRDEARLMGEATGQFDPSPYRGRPGAVMDAFQVRDAPGDFWPDHIPTERPAAVKVGDRVWYGDFHADAVADAADDLGVRDDEVYRMIDEGEAFDGFRSRDVEFMSREEAADLAKRTGVIDVGQVARDWLLAEDLFTWRGAGGPPRASTALRMKFPGIDTNALLRFAKNVGSTMGPDPQFAIPNQEQLPEQFFRSAN